MNLQQNIAALIIRLYPGNSFESSLYEDNGDNNEYTGKGFAFTKFKSDKLNDGSLKLTIYPREGSYTGMNEARSYEIQLFGMLPPKEVNINGVNFPYSYEKRDSSWNYTGKELMTHIYVPRTNCTDRIEVLVEFSEENLKKADIINGLIDKMNRLQYCISLIKENGRVPGSLSKAGVLNLKLEYDPENFIQTIEKFNENYSNLQQIILNQKMKEEIRKKALDYLKE